MNLKVISKMLFGHIGFIPMSEGSMGPTPVGMVEGLCARGIGSRYYENTFLPFGNVQKTVSIKQK